eukprot:CAMPEP_0194266132 /NCGR_PEP_ID=MMETSP0169-20130528/1140_1 /TAXON_ID=218684 /ORGANISM="Corethron pennatum, Strain L29A3" /LENGTH=193 /DNA_ID=CAMNT_0039006745 /DNA_START=88 /DNA_END=669 /DNA_ORIENTATION=+
MVSRLLPLLLLLPSASSLRLFGARSAPAMSLSASTVGAPLPDVTLYSCKPGYRRFTEVSLKAKCKDKMVALIGVPGAFTPGCSKSHVPSFVEARAELELWGVEEIIVVATNSPEIMQQWGEYIGAQQAGVTFLSDYKGELALSLGALQEDAVFDRTSRFTLLVDDGEIAGVFVPEDGDASTTYAPAVLAQLKA